MPDIWYVYAIVPSAARAGDPPSGLDDAAVTLESEGPVAALASRLSGTAYAPEVIEANTADLAWLGPRAAAHDRVVTWASDRGPAIPLPMFALYSTADGIRGMLRERGAQLERVLASVARGREYTLRVYRDDAGIRAALPSLQPEFAERVQAIAKASPGQRYLLEKKLEQDSRDAAKQVARDAAAGVLERLQRHSLDAVREPPPRRAGDPAQIPLALNASFLVAHDQYDAFQAELNALAAQYDGKGFRFEFTGPWPPYHFVGERNDGE